MSTSEPMTQERLDAIREREREAKATAGPWDVEGSAYCGPLDTLAAHEDVPALLAEVDRLRALTTVDKDKVERGARAFYEYPTPGVDVSLRTDWDRLTKASPDVADKYRRSMTAALDAVLGTGEGS